jgi:hypothetical protein
MNITKRSLNDILQNILLSHVVVKELPGNNNNNTIIRIHLIPLKSKDLNILIKSKKNNHVSHLHPYHKITNTLLNNLDVCSICCDYFKVEEYFRELPICKHIFHKKCIDKWFYKDIKNMKCPICRTSHNKEEIDKYNCITTTDI